ncbi:MAG: glycosyltransferase [Bacteroidales bacterium]|nr:glycosyltransferase [Bacteroidales bacterium]
MDKYLLIGNGESPHILKWTKELVKYFEVYLLSSQNVLPRIRELIPEERIITFNMNIAESGGNFSFIKMVIPLIKIIRKVAPVYVNAHYVTSHGFVAALACSFAAPKLILIQTAWGSDILTTPKRNIFYQWLTRYALRKASLLTADGKLVAETMKEFASTETMVFPFGLEKLPEVAVEEKDPDLYYSNRTLNANSNIDRVIRFFSGVIKRNPGARLVIANDGPLKNKLISLCRDLGIHHAVEFTGFIPDASQDAYYRKAQFYFSVLSSDALSVSLLEAMAYGCIPIISDLPDNSEWVKDEVNGIILREDTGLEEITRMGEKSEEAFMLNRRMISEKAIFPKSMHSFYDRLTALKAELL